MELSMEDVQEVAGIFTASSLKCKETTSLDAKFLLLSHSTN